MKNLTIMIKPVSTACNLRCRYCFYADEAAVRNTKSYGVMDACTAEAIISNVFSDVHHGDSVSFAFQGGEPLLAGLDFFEAFISAVSCHSNCASVHYSVQTNGTLINEDWCRFFLKHNFLVGISLDGTAEIHNSARVDEHGNGTFSSVISAKKLLDKYGVEHNILMTLTGEMARHPNQIWNFIIKQKISYVQFTPCLSLLKQSGEGNRFALTPDRFAGFYKSIFPLWLNEFKRGHYISIKLFDDLVNLLAFGQPNACGMLGHCSAQIVVEADGSVFPCDFYALDSYKLGNLKEQHILELLSAEAAYAFIENNEHSALCDSCKYKPVCNGGCKRMRSNVCYADSSGYCGYKDFLDYVIDDIRLIAENERRFRHSKGVITYK